jgi:transcriptional regulator with XRE-family HTH domain
LSSLGHNLSKTLRKLRKSKGLTQDWVAISAGLSRATINRWETKNAGTATLDETEALAQSLGVSTSEMLGIGAGEPEKTDLDAFARQVASETIHAFKAQEAGIYPEPDSEEYSANDLKKELDELLRVAALIDEPKRIRALIQQARIFAGRSAQNQSKRGSGTN